MVESFDLSHTGRRGQDNHTPRRHSTSQTHYSFPESYQNLDELRAGGPIQNVDNSPIRNHTSLDGGVSFSSRSTHSPARARRQSQLKQSEYELPDSWTNVAELALISPVENPEERSIYRHDDLERARSGERKYELEERRRRRSEASNHSPTSPQDLNAESAQDLPNKISSFNTKLYTHSNLVFFSILGTLARLGLTQLTTYMGAPVTFPTLWANFAGSLILGFLAEDRMLFRHEWGGPINDEGITLGEQRQNDENGGSISESNDIDLAAAKKSHDAIKKTIPLYIGLTTGFCGSFTTFSEFTLDCFLAVSNDLALPGQEATILNSGYSFLTLLAVVIATVSLSLGGLFFGAHLAVFIEALMPSLPYIFTRKIIDRLLVFLGWGSWIGAIMLCIFPPDDAWRGQVLFSVVFAPLGVFTRFYLAIYLNGRIAAFPLGTFAANILGSAIRGSAWDIQHVPIGGVIGCQVLQGVQDGYCGCLTTVSTWVMELSSLHRKHAYVYGSASFLTSFLLLLVIMGSLRWTRGFSDTVCYT